MTNVARSIAILAAMSALLTFASPAHACTCSEDRSIETAEGWVDVVFKGKIAWRSLIFWSAVFDVSHSWRGPVGRSFSVQWRRGDGGDCDGFWPDYLHIGKELLVFARRGDDGVYRTSICFPTQPLSEAEAAMRKLDAIQGLKPRR